MSLESPTNALEISNNQISVYKGKLTFKCVAEQHLRIRSLYDLSDKWYIEFDEALKSNNFTDERLIAAVNYVRDTYIYPKPSIANFIAYDKKIEALNYQEMLKKLNELGGATFNSLYVSVKLEGKGLPFWTLKENQEKYKFKLWSK